MKEIGVKCDWHCALNWVYCERDLGGVLECTRRVVHDEDESRQIVM